jgi:4-amino-4-deoxy-L-arabinose transferase-like glycosyltransferase
MTDKNLSSQIEITAPIYIPARDKLAIGLVPSDYVYRLEEYRSDERRWESVMWALIGAVLGIIVNWVNTDPPSISRNSLILIGILAVMIVITWMAVRDYRKRADKIKEQILSFEMIIPTEKKSTIHKESWEEVIVKVSDLTGSKEVTAKLPISPPMSRLVPALVKKMGLADGLYKIYHLESGKELEADETLMSAKVANGDTLRLLPNIVAS